MIILILIIITVLLFVLAVETFEISDYISAPAFILGVIGICVTLALICVAIGTHIPMSRNAKYTEYTQRYNSIMYALENSSENIISLTSEMSDYNSEVLNGRMIMDSKLFSILGYNFYYDLPLIDINEEG